MSLKQHQIIRKHVDLLDTFPRWGVYSNGQMENMPRGMGNKFVLDRRKNIFHMLSVEIGLRSVQQESGRHMTL